MDLNDVTNVMGTVQRLRQVAVRLETLNPEEVRSHGVTNVERQAILDGRLSLIEPVRLRDLHSRLVGTKAAE